MIGPGRGDLPDRSYMSLHGYINKDQDLDKLVAILDRCDLGYLFSRSEGVPGSVLEFLSRGVPCLISDIPPMRGVSRICRGSSACSWRRGPRSSATPCASCWRCLTACDRSRRPRLPRTLRAGRSRRNASGAGVGLEGAAMGRHIDETLRARGTSRNSACRTGASGAGAGACTLGRDRAMNIDRAGLPAMRGTGREARP